MGYSNLKLPPCIPGHRRICFAFYVNTVISIAEHTTFSSFVLQGVESAASSLGYSTQVRYLRAGESMEKQAADICSEVDGIILLGTDATDRSRSEIEAFIEAASSLPLVVVDSFLLCDKLDSVGNDNFSGARQAVRYMLERGCRSIGYLRAKHRILNFEEREEGLRAALAEAGLEPELMVDIGISFDDAIVDMERFMSRQVTLPDGFFAENDIIGAAAVRVLRAHGVDVPGRVSIVGFDDIPICDLSDPSLTTIHSFKEQLGSIAVNLLCAKLQGAAGIFGVSGAGHLRVALSTELHIRNSVI